MDLIHDLCCIKKYLLKNINPLNKSYYLRKLVFNFRPKDRKNKNYIDITRKTANYA